MRPKIVAGNWKMHGTHQSVATLLSDLQENEVSRDCCRLIVFPPFVFLDQVSRALRNSSIAWGAQNVSAIQDGAYTGEISVSMLRDFGCSYVLVGHSERRQLFSESNRDVADKFVAALRGGLIPILCVGETLAQRQANSACQVVTEQLQAVLTACGGVRDFVSGIVAYEPVWAIGTGLAATPEQAQEMHAFIRQTIAACDYNLANSLSILYGGSVKEDNAPHLFTMPDIDGGLVGGASLKATAFLGIATCNKSF